MSTEVRTDTGADAVSTAGAEVAEPARRRTTAHVVLLTGLIFAGVYMGWTLLHDPVQSAIPDELVGYWRSSTERYDDRYLYFAREAVALGRGEFAESEGFPIESIRLSREGKDRHITIVYRQHDGTRDQLHLVYHPTTETLTFKNQPALQWKKYRSKG